ncbi:FluG domain protein [Aspergillus ellipticus CBS 707.79]|uniref:FluG domain protein n=1 Tax=Aspergillus ellipticus CBS 707.79 TaxID=1448320 RepID=A0A319DAW8_9EURO|nr:FluG domain protein [Aspergillus ellipticus CBS 707.79]
MKSGFPIKLGQHLTQLVSVTLTDEYELDKGAKTQPTMNIDDVLFTTYHLLAESRIAFPTFRALFQLNTLRKMMTSTSARPGTLVESSGYLRVNDALKWKDIELFMVKHPDEEGSQVLLMRVTHRLNKGVRNQGVAPVFTYTERNDNLGLCVIQDILMYAFLDEAFDSPYITRPRDIWKLTTVPDHRHSTPIHFKRSMYETPIFRRATRGQNGVYSTDPTLAAPYSQFREYEKEASISAGFKDRGSLYKYRKGAAANLRHLDEHSRNIIMGHRKGGTFANYVSVRDDTQSVFMETPTRDSLLKLASNASLTRDASVPHHLSSTQKAAIEKDREIFELKRDCEKIRDDLIAQHHGLKKAKEAGDKRHSEFQRLQARVRAKQKQLQKRARNRVREEFFGSVGNQIIEYNYNGNPLSFTPNTEHIQPERTALAQLEFKNRDADTVDDEELIADCIQSLELRLDLHKIQIPKSLS